MKAEGELVEKKEFDAKGFLNASPYIATAISPLVFPIRKEY